jgi:hypothetical protein
MNMFKKTVKVVFLSLLMFSFFQGSRATENSTQATLESNLNIRIVSTRGGPVLDTLATLPAGTQIEFPKAEYDNAENFFYTKGGQKKSSKNGFLKNFKIISIPGEETSKELRDLRWKINESTEDVFISKKYLEVFKDEPSDVEIPQAATLTESTEIFSKPSPPPPSADEEFKRDTAQRIVIEANRKLEPICTDCNVDPGNFFEPGGFDRALNSHQVGESQVPRKALEKALARFSQDGLKIRNRDYITVIDYTMPRTQERMFVIHKSGRVERYRVAHGSGSGQAQALRFSDVIGSLQSPPGFFITGDPIKHCGRKRPLPDCMWLEGQEERNDNSKKRSVIFHGSNYVNDRYVRNSFGCPAVDEKHSAQIRDKVKGGSLWYHFTEQDA